MSAGPAVVHLGVGAFHRSHQAVVLDRLLREDPDSPWSICGVGVLPQDAVVRDGLRAQQHAYSVLVRHPDGTVEREVVRAVREVLLVPEDPWAVVARLADSRTRIVSLTITAAGWDPDGPGVAGDLVPGAAPSTASGLLAHALRRRRDAGARPFTVLSCDNVQGNGDVARRAVAGVAGRMDAGLGGWVEEHVAFPSSMVDRITPVTTQADRDLVRQRWGVDDAVPVVCEPFLQWVLEDRFSDGRPPLERAGVQLVDDVRPYELMKLRLLNGGHQALAHAGLLLGHVLASEAASDPDVVRLLERWLREEATPTLPPVPGTDLPAYRASLLVRFGNPGMRDTLARLAVSAAERVSDFVVPVARDRLAGGGRAPLSAAVVACWLRWTEKFPGDVDDPGWGGRTPERLLDDPAVLGDLAGTAFRDDVERALRVLRAQEPRAALRTLTV